MTKLKLLFGKTNDAKRRRKTTSSASLQKKQLSSSLRTVANAMENEINLNPSDASNDMCNSPQSLSNCAVDLVLTNQFPAARQLITNRLSVDKLPRCFPDGTVNWPLVRTVQLRTCSAAEYQLQSILSMPIYAFHGVILRAFLQWMRIICEHAIAYAIA